MIEQAIDRTQEPGNSCGAPDLEPTVLKIRAGARPANQILMASPRRRAGLRHARSAPRGPGRATALRKNRAIGAIHGTTPNAHGARNHVARVPRTGRSEPSHNRNAAETRRHVTKGQGARAVATRARTGRRKTRTGSTLAPGPQSAGTRPTGTAPRTATCEVNNRQGSFAAICELPDSACAYPTAPARPGSLPICPSNMPVQSARTPRGPRRDAPPARSERQ